MKALTVITTTYNRAYCLSQVYDSLCRQTCGDFLWMVVDDGSDDDTGELVRGWMDAGIIEIAYYYKPNGGMHTARNYAFERVQTELCIIIDSDDWMLDDAVEILLTFWKQYGGSAFYGIAGRSVRVDGVVNGRSMPPDVLSCTMEELDRKYRVKGELCLVLRSDLARRNPYPEFPGEKFYPASYKYYLLDQNYRLLLLDRPLRVYNLNDASMTRDKYAQYRSCPRSFAHYRNGMVRISHSPLYILRQSVHYVAESLFAGERRFISQSARPLCTLLALLPGLLLYLYLLHTKRKY